MNIIDKAIDVVEACQEGFILVDAASIASQKSLFQPFQVAKEVGPNLNLRNSSIFLPKVCSNGFVQDLSHFSTTLTTTIQKVVFKNILVAVNKG